MARGQSSGEEKLAVPRPSHPGKRGKEATDRMHQLKVALHDLGEDWKDIPTNTQNDT